MATQYATAQDVITLFRALSADELARTTALLPIVSARLRREAANVGRDLDQMIDEDDDLAIIAKQVTVDVVKRILQTPTTGDLAPLSQYSQSAMGYTVSGTFLSPGGDLFIKKSELAALGLKRQRIGSINLMEATDDN